MQGVREDFYKAMTVIYAAAAKLNLRIHHVRVSVWDVRTIRIQAQEACPYLEIGEDLLTEVLGIPIVVDKVIESGVCVVRYTQGTIVNEVGVRYR